MSYKKNSLTHSWRGLPASQVIVFGGILSDNLGRIIRPNEGKFCLKFSIDWVLIPMFRFV